MFEIILAIGACVVIGKVASADGPSPAGCPVYDDGGGHVPMTTISVVPFDPQSAPTRFRAVAGDKQSVGPTVGQALDALQTELGQPAETTLVVVQPMVADEFFPAAQRDRLADLMARWRAAREAGTPLPPGDQAELDGLAEAEVAAAARRAGALLRRLPT
jgi:hypothetical protein